LSGLLIIMRVKTFLLLIVFFLTFGSTWIFAQDNPELQEIRRIEALLLTPCDEPLEHMNELIRLGQAYQEMERQRLALYRGALDAHQRSLSAFVVNPDAKTGSEAGPFRLQYDQLYQKAKAAGLLRQASYADIPEAYSMADMAAKVKQYSAENDRYGNVGSWSQNQEGIGNKLFIVEAQRQLLEDIKKEMEQLKAEWQAARAQYFKKMAADPFKDVFAELAKRAGFMKKQLAEPFAKHREELQELAESGRFEHCLGFIDPARTYAYKIYTDFTTISPYSAGPAGTFEGLPGVGFRMAPPADFEPIKAASSDIIPEDFPLELPLKYDPKAHIKAEIERLQIQVKAEKDAIIAMGKYLTGLDGWAGQVVGEGFNVFYGVCDGFAGVGNILIGIGTAPFHPVETYEKLNKIKDGIVKIYNDSDLQRALVDKGLVATADFFRGIVAGVELLVSPDDPPANQFDADALAHWQNKAQNTKLARDTLSNVEYLAGQVVADIATGAILSKASKAKLAAEVVDTAGDVSRAGVKAKMVENAASRGARLADDVPNVKAIDRISDQIKKAQDDLAKIIDDVVAPKPKSISYDQGMLPKPEDVLAKASATADRGGMNAYFRLNDDLGVKVGNKEIFKSSTKIDEAAASRAARDLDDAGRRFLEDITRDSPLGRLPQVKDRYYIVDDLLEGTKTYRSIDAIPDNTRYRVVEVMENIPPSTHAGNLAKTGQLTPDHVRAYESFMRDMNSKGYVWTDNKLDNFAFETIDASKGLYRVVPLDTGGIYKLGNLPSGMSTGDMARKIQLMYDRGFEVGGSQANMLYAQFEEAKKLGIPVEMLDELPRYLGVREINPTAQDVAATWAQGMRMGSPGKPYSTAYQQIASKTDDVLAREASDILGARLAANPQFQAARQALDTQKAALSEAQKKLDDALEQAAKADEAAKAAKPVGSDDKGITMLQGALGQEAAAEIDKAQKKAQCIAVMEKLLAGMKADWLTESWKRCQEQGFTLLGAQ